MKKTLALLAIVSCAAFSAYARAADPRWEGSPATPVPKANPAVPSISAHSPAEIEREQLLLKTLKTPPIPLKTQDKNIRVFFLPYVDSNGILHNHKYSFLKVDEGKWVIGDYLMEPTNMNRKVLKPIDNPLPSAPEGQGKTQSKVIRPASKDPSATEPEPSDTKPRTEE